MRTNISLALSPLRYLVCLQATGGNWASEWFTAHNELLAEIELLKREDWILNTRLQKLQVLAEENARLRDLLGSVLKIGHSVIDEFGIMGQVIHVNPQSATTIPISDPEHAIPVQFVRSRTSSTTELDLR